MRKRSQLKSPSLSVSFTNIRSLLPKRDELCSYLDDSDADILILTETWLHPDVTNEELFPDKDNYNIYRCDRIDRRGGGVLIAVKKTVSSFPLDTNPSIEITWTACVTTYAKILIRSCYCPPDAHSSFPKDLRDNIERATQLYPADIIYLFGDFNYPLIDWSTMSTTCRVSSNFLELTLDYNLSQVVHQCTRGTNILDLVLTDAPETTRDYLHRRI